jgi:hypothetical protein
MAELPAEFREKLLAAVRRQSEALSAQTEPDDKAENEASALADEKYGEIERQKAETAGLKEKNRDLRHNRVLRGAYARYVFCYLVCYSVFVGLILVASGFSICGFSLHEDVLKYLVGSTAAAAIGLVFAVTNGLFDGIGKK